MKRIGAILLCLCLLAGCGKKQDQAVRTVFAMDTVMELKLYGPDCEASAAQLQALINELEQTWSVTREGSIPTLERQGHPTELTDEQNQLMARLAEMTERTGGLFNSSLYCVMDAWGFYDKNYRLPTEEELTAAFGKNLTDLGGAMKGYCGDRAVELLDTMDIDYAILDLGGNIQTYKNKPDGTPWTIGIQNPDGGQPLGVLSVTGTMAVVTSGDYQRSFQLDGKTYHHIIDPRTGYPADAGLRSVTVICRSGLTADCLSTALFVMGLEEGCEFGRESDDFEAIFVTTEGQIYATEGASLSGCQFEVINR